MSITVWWIRRDLRLHDNQALHAALQTGTPIIPLFIIDPTLTNSPYVGENRLSFLHGGLRALDEGLRGIGSQLFIRSGTPLAVLTKLVAEMAVTHIFAEEDVSPYARRRDQKIQSILPLHLTPGVSILPIGSVLKVDGSPYKVYGPFARQWHETATQISNPIIPKPNKIPTPASVKLTEPLPISRQGSELLFLPGEVEAQQCLSQFCWSNDKAINDYAKNRDRPALLGTSQLSPYLRFGMISARVLAAEAQTAIDTATSESAIKGAETWLSELLWREFYQTILYYFPTSRRQSFNDKYDAILWRNDEAAFAAWCHGETGYPFVDAAMRQLLTTGWMHNRARMVVASFLIKDLLIDWRWGERWFIQHLLDGDPAANNGGWQWSAGSGPNAAPYFRIFNPITQGARFDPEGEYIYRWVPELAHLPKRHIHTPWKMSVSEQNRYQCRIGRDYPAPIVDHEQARAQTLVAYKIALRQ